MRKKAAIHLTGAALAVAIAGCATGGATAGSENFLTIFVDNFQGQAIVVSIAEDTYCQVNARLTRYNCRFAWAGTGTLQLEISNPSMGRTHQASEGNVSGGDRFCLQSRDTGVQLRRC